MFEGSGKFECIEWQIWDMNGEDVMAVTVVGSGWIALEGRIGGDSGMLEEGGNGRQGLIDNSDINGTSTYRQNGTLSTEGSRISDSPSEDARIDNCTTNYDPKQNKRNEEGKGSVEEKKVQTPVRVLDFQGKLSPKTDDVEIKDRNGTMNIIDTDQAHKKFINKEEVNNLLKEGVEGLKFHITQDDHIKVSISDENNMKEENLSDRIDSCEKKLQRMESQRMHQTEDEKISFAQGEAGSDIDYTKEEGYTTPTEIQTDVNRDSLLRDEESDDLQ